MTEVSAIKVAYVAPALVAFGDILEMTKNVNTLGPGDVIFSILDQVS